MPISLIIGLCISVLSIAGLAIYTGANAKKHSNEGLSTGIVSGLILGTFVGGACTVGTAQLAYTFGLCAMWYCVGGAIGCLILALVFSTSVRSEGCPTLIGIISKEYGSPIGVTASILNSFGTLVNVLSQLISATAVIEVIFPQVTTTWALCISAVFVVIYIVFGGTRGAGVVGILKLVFLYFSMVACAVLVLKLAGGFSGVTDMIRDIPNENGTSYFYPLARGISKELGSCISVFAGIATTQTYAQAIIGARSDAVAKRGAIISACLIPPIAVGGILVGLYMRVTCPGIVAKTALTQFVLMQMPNALGGIVLGALFISVIGTGAGLILGVVRILNRDIVQRFGKASLASKDRLIENCLILLLLVILTTVCIVVDSDMVLNYAFLSMALRGAVVLAPLCGALWLKGKVSPGYPMVCVIAGPATVVLFNIVKVLPFDPLLLGVFVSAVIMLIGYLKGCSQKQQ